MNKNCDFQKLVDALQINQDTRKQSKVTSRRVSCIPDLHAETVPNIQEYTFLDDTGKTKLSDRDVSEKFLYEAKPSARIFQKRRDQKVLFPVESKKYFRVCFCCLTLLDVYRTY